MRILCISYEYPPIGGGGATVCEKLAETFVERGHHYDVVTSGMKGLPAFERRNGVGIYRVPCVRRHRHSSNALELATQLLPAYRKAAELHRRFRYHINHTHFIVPSGIIAYLLKRRVQLPYVITAHGSDVPGYNPERFELMHRLIAPLWQCILEESQAVTAPSRFLSDLIHQHAPRSVRLIPNGFDGIRRRLGTRRNRILVVSRLVERKGVQFLLQALGQMDAPWECVIAGDGPYRKPLERIAARLNSPVHFLGMVPRQELGELYQSAKIFVLPSAAENFPLVLLEAMHAGCAVVTTRTTGCAEVVADAGMTVDPASPSSLRRALTTLMENESVIARLGDLGQRRAALFSTEHVVDEFHQLFERIVFGQEGRPLPALAPSDRVSPAPTLADPP